MIRAITTAFILSMAIATSFSQSLAPTPPMGWNSWNCFAKDINEQQIKDIADAMVSSGMRDAGYEYLVLDDAWMDSIRDDSGRLQADLEKFPSGMKAIGDYIHSRGLKFGIYECRGYLTCQQLPGSFEYEEIDMQTFADWGVDYIKLDACYAEKNGRLTTEDLQFYKDGIEKTGRDMILSISDFGNGAWAWGGKNYGQLWRTSYDIYPWIENVYHHAETSGGDLRIHPAFNGLWQFAGPGYWNDPDMLEIGNLKSEAEDKIHMSLWCMLAAPLMAGNDLRSMSDTTIGVLTAPEVIAVNQDPRGHQGYKIFDNGKQQVYNKPLSDGTTAVLLFNKDSVPADVSVEWSQIGLTGRQPVRDLWARKKLGKYRNGFTAKQLPQHGQYLLKVGKPGSELLPGPDPVPEEKYIPTGNGFTYLSDLYYIMKYGKAPVYDMTKENSKIKLDGEEFDKGLSVENGNIMIYKLGGNVVRFRAMVGLDDSYTGEGKGRFRVMNEDAFGNRVLFDSDWMTKDSTPKQIDISVRDMDCLFIKFDGKEDAIGTWGNARVVGSWDAHRVRYENEYVDSLISEMELIPIEVNGEKDNRINIVIINRWEDRDENPYNSPEMRQEFLDDVNKSLLASFTPGHPDAYTAYANYHKFFNLYALWWPGTPKWRHGVETDLIEAVRDRLFLPWKDEHTGWVTFLDMPNRDGGGGGAARNLEDRTGNAVIVGNHIAKMLHEISHTCSSIGDEYTAAATGTKAVPTYNTSKEFRRDKIKWRAWVEENNPLPTPYEKEYKNVIGAFEGSQYHLTNYYRSSAQGCIMGAGVFDNTEEMCPICEQRLSMRVYTLVNPIEDVFPPNEHMFVPPGSAQRFSVSRVSPEPDTQVVLWYLNGKKVAEGVDQLVLTFDKDSENEVVFTLRDTTSFIREDPPYGEFPYRENRWNITTKNPKDMHEDYFMALHEKESVYTFSWENESETIEKGKRYEAENSKYTGKFYPYFGASGTKYIKMDGGTCFDLELEKSGMYSVDFVFASEQNENAIYSLEVNGKQVDDSLVFLPTRPLYTGWEKLERDIKLKKGANTICLKNQDTVKLHLDYLWVPDKIVPDNRNEEIVSGAEAEKENIRIDKKRNKYFKADQVKSAGLKLWLDASDLNADGKIDNPAPPRDPYRNWMDKADSIKGPMILYKPNTLNGLGTAGFEMVWLTNISKPISGYQTLFMVYKESSMSFEGKTPFKALDELIGRAEDPEKQMFSDEMKIALKDARIYLDGQEIDPFTTPNPMDFCILTVVFDKPITEELKNTSGYWEGTLAEFILYDGALSDEDRQAVENGLKEKWLLE